MTRDRKKKTGKTRIMTVSHPLPIPARTITFDCWSTLLYEANGEEIWEERCHMLRSVASRYSGQNIPFSRAKDALDTAYLEAHNAWMNGQITSASTVATRALTNLKVEDTAAQDRLSGTFASAALQHDIHIVEGADQTLAALSTQGVRIALICDTGFTPGTVVRRLLDNLGLLEFLEEVTFSDETGVPKPHLHMFTSTLNALGVTNEQAIHVGDMRRTDVAGGRGAGMATIRITAVHNDKSEHPDADAVVDSHAGLRRLLDLA